MKTTRLHTEQLEQPHRNVEGLTVCNSDEDWN